MQIDLHESKMVQNCFKRKSNLVKCLAVLLTIIIIVLIALFINLVIRKDELTCNTENCIKISAKIIRNSDQTANPCDDFHSFTCGNYMRNVRDAEILEPAQEINLIITEILHENDTKPLKMQKLFYQSCINLSEIERDREETILEYFSHLGGWPLLSGSKWNGTYFDWVDFAIKCRKMGFPFEWFLEFSIYEDVNRTQMNLLKIDVPGYLRPMLSENETHLRTNLSTDIAVYLGGDETTVHYETFTTISFEQDLRNISERHWNRVKNLIDYQPTVFTIKELEAAHPNIKWLHFIRQITGLHLSEHDSVIFDVLDYVKDLTFLIVGTPKRTVADYMFLKIIEEMWPFFSEPIRRKFENYTQQLNRPLPQYNRYQFCINESKKQFPLVAESVYIRRHVTEQKKQVAREIIFFIRNEFTRLLEDASWTNRRETHNRVIRMIQNLNFVIGAPVEVFDEFGFAEKLGVYGFGFKSTNIIDMLIQLKENYFHTNYRVINRMVFNNTINFYKNIVNVSNFSKINQNTMVIPAFLLRDEVFNQNLPNYLNFASMGAAVAHEMFNYIYKSNYSNDYSSNNYQKNNWWVSDDFAEAVKCLVKEVSNLHSLGSEFKKPKKLKEDLANFVAWDIAVEAYREWARMYPQEPALPALNFTPNQLFWIQASQLSCEKIYSKHDQDNIQFKIIAPLRNSRSFALEHGCSQGSKMNPRRKCKIL